MAEAEIATIARWVAAGAPEGDPRQLPPPRAFAAPSALDAADLVLRPEQAYTVAGRSGDVYRCFSIPTAFDEDRYFGTSVVLPGNPRIVHHMLAMVDANGISEKIAPGGVGPDGGHGYPCFGGPGFRIEGYLGGWAPGGRPWDLPEGVGMLLPKGARVVFQLHYHNAQLAAQTDLTELRLKAAKGPVQKRMQFMRVGRFNLNIPAGDPRYEIEAGTLVRRPMQLLAIHPHMHMLGREMKVWAEAKDKSVTPLIHIADWDFHWQGFYWFRKPVALPVETWIGLTAAWDNSAGNPRNPNKPPLDVRWGERSVDEMGHAAILYTFEDETPPSK
jgi:hypothetical protein